MESQRPEIAHNLIETYAEADFSKKYVGYYEIPQEQAKILANYIIYLEAILNIEQEKNGKCTTG